MRRWIVIGICLIIVGLGVGIASAVNKGNSNRISEIKRLFQPIDSEARKYLADKQSSEELNTLSKYLVKKYNKNLNLIVDELEKNSGKSLTQKEKEKFKYLLVREHLHKIKKEQEFNNFNYTRKEEIKLIPIDLQSPTQFSMLHNHLTFLTQYTSGYKFTQMFMEEKGLTMRVTAIT